MVVAAALAASVVAGQGSAASDVEAANASHLRGHGTIMRPKLKRGELRVTGTNASEKIALRLRAGESGILEIDVDDDGSAEFAFERSGSRGSQSAPARRRPRAPRRGQRRLHRPDRDHTRRWTRKRHARRWQRLETLLGGIGNDSIDGNAGNDASLMGPGDDTFVWDPGDGSDVVEGQAGTDTMLFNGANVAEQVDVSANGDRLTFFRNPGTVTMDTAGVERVDFKALGGADLVTVNDLTATDVNELILDLAATLGGGTGDGQADRLVVNATDGNDTLDVSGDAAEVKVNGLAPTIRILHSEAANDRLEIDTLAGTDTVESTGLAAAAIQLFVDGVLVP